jgi:hypothetical protein
MPRYDFPAISCGGKKGDEWDEELHEDVNGTDCDDRKKIGRVHIREYTKKGKKQVRASFHFRGSKVRPYEGDVPGNGSWEGESTLHFVGKGDHKGRPTIKVISWNPKRWG